jgi:hypothetical protein
MTLASKNSAKPLRDADAAGCGTGWRSLDQNLLIALLANGSGGRRPAAWSAGSERQRWLTVGSHAEQGPDRWDMKLLQAQLTCDHTTGMEQVGVRSSL